MTTPTNTDQFEAQIKKLEALVTKAEKATTMALSKVNSIPSKEEFAGMYVELRKQEEKNTPFYLKSGYQAIGIGACLGLTSYTTYKVFFDK